MNLRIYEIILAELKNSIKKLNFDREIKILENSVQ